MSKEDQAVTQTTGTRRTTTRPDSRCVRGAPALIALLTALVAALAPAGAEAALAGSAGNTVVRNTVTVNYSDAQSNPQAPVSASVDLTVNTVPATPAIVSYTPASGSTDGSGATQAYTVRIRTNSNGPGVVTLTAADTASSNMSGYGTAPAGLASDLLLGATIIDPSDVNGTIANWATGASVTFKVPNDAGIPSDTAVTGGSTADGTVNGLKGGDLVYLFSGSSWYGPFLVGSVTDVPVGSGSTATPCSIQLVNPGADIGDLPTAYGWQLVEAKDAAMTVTQGSVTDPTAASNWTTTVAATMAAAAPATAPAVITASHMGKVAITKYVRNVTAPIAGSGLYAPPVDINGNRDSFYSSGVTGKPGDVLEYLAVLSDIGTGSATVVYATDTLPGYTSLVKGAGYGSPVAGKVFAHVRFNDAEIDLGDDNSLGAADIAYGVAAGSPTVMTFWLGTGCSNASGGRLTTSVPAATGSSTAYVIYQVKIL